MVRFEYIVDFLVFDNYECDCLCCIIIKMKYFDNIKLVLFIRSEVCIG